MAVAAQARANHLLAALSDEDLARWLPHLEAVDLPLGLVLYEPGGAQTHVYFPTTATVSLLSLLENGHAAEVAAVGNEGLVGTALFMGSDSSRTRAVVQLAGQGLRMSAPHIQGEFELHASVVGLLLRYTQALITQLSQTAVCNRHHLLEQQLCRWLLRGLDRRPDNELRMTQELLASLLGVRREGVTEAALKLQAAGLIRYVRGHITVLDRTGLERRTCECYAVVKKEYQRLLPEAAAA
jgi:CRP-like cAMP-binding protein